MPALDFKGKQLVYSHHLTVPAKTLEVDARKSLGPKKPSLDDNLIIHGDNLYALKALMPRYAGKVNCIYIDPPYNTGNEGWVYNDNVNSPLMQAWLSDKSPVDNEDLERHDKWLCMMWPRLHLLRELLAEDGVIFVSIDDNEQHRLRMMMDEIFGERNFVANIIWQKKYTQSNDAKYFSDNHDFIVCYAKNKIQGDVKIGFNLNLLERTAEQKERYKNPDNDPNGVWMSQPLHAKSGTDSAYEFTFKNGVEWRPPAGTFPRYSIETLKKADDDGKIWFGSKGNAVPRMKKYLTEMKKGVSPKSIWLYDEVGSNDDAKKPLKEVFPDNPFSTPKPTGLLRKIFQLSTNKNSIILDSFAGSGTTAQAVLELNKQDGGKRKFILVECEDYADKITAERMRRIIKGVRSAKDETLKKGLGGSFAYCTLGDDIDAENLLKGKNPPSYETLARHLFWKATGKSPDKINPKTRRGKDGFFCETKDRRFYLIYEPKLTFLRSGDSALNNERAERIAKANQRDKKTAVVFATHKFMGQKELTAMGITFCGLLYGVK